MTFEYINNKTNTLSIGFAGFYDVNPRFDWNVLKRFNTDILLIKDDKMSWYLCGLDGISKDVGETVEFIHKYTDKYKRLLFFGSSMGGFASILYGSLINHPNKVINAFGPQVDISPEMVEGNQWTIKAVKERVHPFVSESDKKYMSLKFLEFSILEYRIPENTFIHYCGSHVCDTHQSNMIGCHKMIYDCDIHSIAVWMYNNNLLIPYLTQLYKS
jgi:hypothetical protein